MRQCIHDGQPLLFQDNLSELGCECPHVVEVPNGYQNIPNQCVNGFANIANLLLPSTLLARQSPSQFQCSFHLYLAIRYLRLQFLLTEIGILKLITQRLTSVLHFLQQCLLLLQFLLRFPQLLIRLLQVLPQRLNRLVNLVVVEDSDHPLAQSLSRLTRLDYLRWSELLIH